MSEKVLEKTQIAIDSKWLVDKSVLLSSNVEPALKSMFIEIIKYNYPGIMSTADLKNKYIEELKKVKNININQDEFSDKSLVQIFKNSTSSNIKNSTHLLRDIRIDWLYGKKGNGSLDLKFAMRNSTEISKEFSDVQGKGNRFFVQYNYLYDSEQNRLKKYDEIEDIIADVCRFEDIGFGILVVTEDPFANYNINADTLSTIDKIDFIKRNQRLHEVGLKGELLVFNYEKERLLKENQPNLAKVISWVSNSSDSAGYDILSYELIDGIYQQIYIEVKSTTEKVPSYFYLSKNEYNFAVKNCYQYRLYIIFNIDVFPSLYISRGGIVDSFEIEPDSYKAYKNIRKGI
ncbi:MAG: DUF3883 domain-containing protein [Erysipelotrichales bacterium]|nr:DUF3883 domain-containing protein [Erysipelotrichales bacterium]